MKKTAVFLPAAASAETLPGALAKAYQNNSALNSARAGARVTDEDVAIAKSGYRPTIAGVADLDHTSSDAPNGSTRITTGSFGVEIRQTLFDGFQTKNNVAAATARVQASQESLRNTEQNTLFNAASAYMDVIRDRQIAALIERNLQFLTEQVRAAQSRFEVGEGTRTDVAQAQAGRSSAVAQLAVARAQALSSAAISRPTASTGSRHLVSAEIPAAETSTSLRTRVGKARASSAPPPTHPRTTTDHPRPPNLPPHPV